MPVEEGNTSSGVHPNICATRFACGARGVEARLSGGAVGVAGIDGHSAHLAARRAQMFLVYQHGRGLHAVAGEGGRGAGRSVGHDERKVRAAAGLQARLCGSKTEAFRNQKLGNIAHAFREIRRGCFLAGQIGFKALI